MQTEILTALPERTGFYITTFSGKKMYYDDPRPEDFDIYDIATSLSRIPRFNGHTNEFYSVAQHSLWVSKMLSRAFALEGLLHDRAEAYMGDMVTPLKAQMPKFVEVESRIETVSATVFDIPATISKEVKAADHLALWTEVRYLRPTNFELSASQPITPHPIPIRPISDMNYVRDLFLDRYYMLKEI